MKSPEAIPHRPAPLLHQENKERIEDATSQKPEAATAAKKVFPPAEILPVLYGFKSQDRLQGPPHPAGLRHGTGQDHAEKDHGKLFQASAYVDPGCKAGPDDRSASFRRFRGLRFVKPESEPARHPFPEAVPVCLP